MGNHSIVLARAGIGAFSAILSAAVLLTGPAVPVAMADATIGTTTSLSAPTLDPKPTGRTAQVTAHVTPSSGSGPSGTITLYDDNGGTRTKLDEQPVTADEAVFTLGADLSEQTYHLVASYGGDATFIGSDSEARTFIAGPRPTSTVPQLSGPHDVSGTFAQKGDVVTVTAKVDDAGTTGNVSVAGNVTIQVDGVAKGSTTANGELQLSTASWTIGSHTVRAVYAGDGTDHAGSNGSVSINIVANVVEASGVGVQYATFYPYKDGYRDTVAIRGKRNEPISVTIRIYSPTGSKVRTYAIAMAAGVYSVAWNGRNTAGTALAAGKYKVVQTLRDALGSTRVVTSYTTLSKKRLYTQTTYVTKLGSAYSAKGADGGGSVTRSTTAGWAKLAAGSSGNGFAAAGWELVLPSAKVYKSIAWQVYAKYPLSTSPTGIGMQNFVWCARSSSWSDVCFDHWKGIGNSAYSARWYSTSGSIVTNRSGRYVRGIVEGVVATTWVYKVRVRVTYAVLR